jgi:hypothetical protein
MPKQNRYKLYFTYKSLSNELFNDLPSVDIEGISLWAPEKRGALYKDLLVRYVRHKRCAEFRAEYRDAYVAQADRDERHELAISEAERRAAFYLQTMEEIAVALQADASAENVPPESDDRSPVGKKSGRKQEGKKGKTGKKGNGPGVKAGKSRAGQDKRAENLPLLIAGALRESPDFWSKVQSEAYGHAAAEVDVLYDSLLREIVQSAKARLKEDPSPRVVHTLAKYVVSCFGLRSSCNTFHEGPWVDWTTAALRRVKDCKAGDLR